MPSDLPETLDYARMSELVSGLAQVIGLLAVWIHDWNWIADRIDNDGE